MSHVPKDNSNNNNISNNNICNNNAHPATMMGTTEWISQNKINTTESGIPERK